MSGRAVVMGVAGCGKSFVGAAVSRALGATYIDGDTLHPAANVAKMSRGEPLTDADRAPWLALVGAAFRDACGPTLIGCSALKRRYRDAIRAVAGEGIIFLHLAGPEPVIAERMKARQGHFMPASLLRSQFAALEALEPDEAGFAIDITSPGEVVVAAAAARLAGAVGWTGPAP